MMPKRDLLSYWPRQEDVVACVKTDAEASSEAVSLAVHQPMQFERRLIGGEAGALSICDEHELLRVFTEKNLPDGRVIVPIVGTSGAGKSHVVRWLDTQLRHIEGYERRVVIRIPKGTSLKGVLGILLQELKGPVYDQYRQELVRAQSELDVKEGAGLLCEMLAYTVGEIGAEARQKLVRNPADKEAQLQDAFCRVDMLPALLRNQLLRDQHFVRSRNGDGVVTRLVEQLTVGRGAGTDDNRQHLFTAQDLIFSDAVDRDSLGRVEIRAMGSLEREDRRIAAARILNTALDDAKQRLLRLDPTVSDLFNAVREQLLQEQKELVLLIEDFAVLSGIQKQLLQVVIKEAFRDGRQVLCTMRTALAYTTGYMDTATVLTRANIEYRIPDEPGDEEEIFSRIERLVGAYLNAARFGQSALEQAWASAKQSDGWVPRFAAQVEPEAQATLEEFGVSVDAYELFPFDRAAVRELSREGCVQAGRLVYNPRFIIQNVINKVLGQRDLFEHGLFPPPAFGAQGRPLPARIVEEVKRRVPLSELDRYLAFLMYWGGFPSNLNEVAFVGPRVFAAFGFDKSRLPIGTEPPVISRGRIEAESRPDQKQRERQVHDQDPVEARWERLLETWRSGQSLSQADANQLRKWIAEALKAFVRWDWNLYRPLKNIGFDTWHEFVYIPRAAGNAGRSADDAMVAVCQDSDLLNVTTSAGIQSALMAIVRFHAVHKNTWDYDGADTDLPRYAAFVESIAGRARGFASSRYFRADWDPIPALVQGLLIGARALGIEAATKDKDHSSLIQSLFASTPEDPVRPLPVASTDADATGWTELTNALRRCRRIGEKESRDQLSWQGHLLNLIGARQGQADAVHAIDVRKLRPALEATLASWAFKADPPNPVGVSDFTAFRASYQNLRRLEVAIPKSQKRLLGWRNEMIGWFGEEFDKEALVRELRETVVMARDSGLARGLDSKGILQLLEEFRAAKVMPALDDAAKLEDSAPRGLILTILGRGHQPVADLCRKLRSCVDPFVQAVEEELADESIRYGDDPLNEAVTFLRAELQELAIVLKGVEAL